MDTTQQKQESKRKVMNVLPPERIMKYAALLKAWTGMMAAAMQISPVAKARISPVVL